MKLITFDVALWEKQEAIEAFGSHLPELRAAVGFPHNMSISQWVHLFAYALHYKPDLIVELGRGGGNSTTVFTYCANRLEGTRVTSVGYDGTFAWENSTVPNLMKLDGISSSWFDPLDAIHADILETDFVEIIADAQRVLLFWDAHGYGLAHYVLGRILPLLEERDHSILAHDISDARYEDPPRSYARTDGEPTYWADHYASPFEELIAIHDFVSRNRIRLHSVDEDIQGVLQSDRERWAALSARFESVYPEQGPLGIGSMIYFSMSECHDPESRIWYPSHLPSTHLASRLAAASEDQRSHSSP